MRLTLSRIEPSDFDAILPVLFDAFEPMEISAVFIGKSSPTTLALKKKKFLDSFHHDPADLWLKVTDEDEEVDVDIINEDYTGELEGQCSSKSVTGRKRANRLVCACNWKIYPTFVESGKIGEAVGSQAALTNGEDNAKTEIREKTNGSDISWLFTPEERADSHTIMEDFMSRRRRACREGHLLLSLLFVDPSYQRKGAGAMMVVLRAADRCA